MAGDKSFVITISNNNTEKEGIAYLLENHKGFFRATKESKKKVLELLNLEKKYLQSFDLIFVPNLGAVELNNDVLKANLKDLIFVELKTTKKKLPNNPTGFFFGATQNEFDFAEKMGDKFRFCFVCLHDECKSHALLSIDDLNKRVRNKRVQFQINL